MLPVERDDDASDSSDAGIVNTSKSQSKKYVRYSNSSTRSDKGDARDSDSDSDSDSDNEEGKADEIVNSDDLESFPTQGRPASHTLVIKSQKKEKRKKKEVAPPPPDRRLNEKRPGVIVTPRNSQDPTPKTTPRSTLTRHFLRRSGNTGSSHTSPISVVDGIDARLLGLDINQDLTRAHRGSPRVSSTREGPPGRSTEPPPPPSDDALPPPPSHSREASIPPPPPS